MATAKRRRQKEGRAAKRAERARRARSARRRALIRTWLAVTGLLISVGIVLSLLSR